MKTLKTLAVFSAAVAVAAAAFATPAMAQDAYGWQLQAPAATSAVSRAEVEAERNLWLRSGLAAYDGTQAAQGAVPGYAASAARYETSRNGPAYYAELRGLRGGEGAALGRGPAQPATSE